MEIVTHELLSEKQIEEENMKTAFNDLILLLSTVMPACLPDAATNYDAVTSVVTGWGTTSSGGTQPIVLHEVEVTTRSHHHIPVLLDSQKVHNAFFQDQRCVHSWDPIQPWPDHGQHDLRCGWRQGLVSGRQWGPSYHTRGGSRQRL